MNKKEKKIPRPLNAFMLFANDNRAEYRKSHPGETNARISVRLGEDWKQLNGKDKTKYYKLSKEAELEHHKKYPDYVYTPTEARTNKKKAKKLKGENCSEGKQKRNGRHPRHPVESVSDENCSPTNISPRTYGYPDWKYDPFYQNYVQCMSSGKRDMYPNGQGDQMPPYPMGYGPHPFMSPFGYPRFPGYDFRPPPYMAPQYGRMPFASPQMMYQCPPQHLPQHLPQFVSPPGQPMDGKVPLNYMPPMPGYYAQYQSDAEPQKNPTDKTHTETQPTDLSGTSKPVNVPSTESRVPERQVPEHQIQASANQHYQEQLKQAGQVHDGSRTVQQHNDTTSMASGSSVVGQDERYQPTIQNQPVTQAERYQPTVQNQPAAQAERYQQNVQNQPVAYIYYGSDNQPYIVDGSRQGPQYLRIAPESKTFADLSTGQPEIVKVATQPS